LAVSLLMLRKSCSLDFTICEKNYEMRWTTETQQGHMFKTRKCSEAVAVRRRRDEYFGDGFDQESQETSLSVGDACT